MDTFMIVWIAPVITGLFVWFITAKYGDRFIQKKEDKSHTAPSTIEEELPLTVKIKDGHIPIGYYKLTEKIAKRMEPEFYKEMKSYINQPFAIWLFSLLFLFGSIGNFQEEPSLSLSVIIWSLFNLVALFPWKSVFK